MPRKNKKKQRKEERRKAMQRVRQEKGWQPPPEEEFPDDELARDLLAFLPGLGQAGEAIEATTADTLTTAVLETDDLADEPEFREIYFHPLQAIDLYAELEEERGVTEEVLDALSEDQEDELFFDLMVEIARGLLTTELQDHILDAMDAAWRRVRREGDQENAGRLAAMLSLLGSDEGVEMWPVAGLVQAILRRSLEAGFEIVAALDSAGPEDMGIRSLWQSVRNESVEQQIEAIIARYPGHVWVLASLLVNLPFAVQPMQNALAAIPHNVRDAARCCGLTPLQAIRSVELPLALPGIATAAVLTFAHTLGEFGVVLMVGGSIPGETRTISIAIYDRVQAFDEPAAGAMALVLLVIAVAALAITNTLARRAGKRD